MIIMFQFIKVISRNDKNIISLPSNLNYSKFNNNRYDTSYGDYVKCEEFQKSLKNEHDAIDNFCMKLTGILDQFNKLRITELFEGDSCSVVIYWMYDTLYEEIINKKVHSNIDEIIGNIWNFWEKLEGGKKCSFQGNLTDEEIFNRSKKLYYYAMDISTIQAKSQDLNFQCTEDYSRYIKAYVEEYKSVRSECEQTKDKEYCKLLEKIHKIRNKDDLYNLEPCTPVANAELETGNGMEDQREHEEDEAEVQASYSQSSSGSDIGVSVVFPLLGVLLISSVFYKFTPLGSWIRSRFLKKVSTRYNVDDEETENILDNPYEFSNTNSNNDEHNIGYQSVENF
ncbi:PIR Superfamily Protein [Plasmodium ovale wallikeri]|uniref:PIR Superfamily Protein n=1 Tax=Plasmodium ovale wallikeri TaxID=864142 RepID=A0A1A8YYB1_PLAOA|nr:PIR Superfamily Protein [Plasmodium ovale wallikeri]SBT57242.1 PIR Superfamily Protein [Plasmodium ovale wallikeri]